MACVLSSATRAALVLWGLLLLVFSSQQVLVIHARGHAFTGKELQVPSAQQIMPSARFLLLRRAIRQTPLWRTVGSKPLGAFCTRGLECSTFTCRNGHCADPRVKS